jgi:FkbM family methyltransferase
MSSSLQRRRHMKDYPLGVICGSLAVLIFLYHVLTTSTASIPFPASSDTILNTNFFLTHLSQQMDSLHQELHQDLQQVHGKLDRLAALPVNTSPAEPNALAPPIRLAVSATETASSTTSSSLLDRIDEEWTDASIADSLKIDAGKLQAAISNVAVSVPGVATAYQVPFFRHRPSWLSTRTFVSEIFFCPPNGHEGTITHLIAQLLSRSAGSSGSFVDIGSNLGFYSLLAMDMGVPAYAFDIQPVCLYNLYALAQTSAKRANLHLFNVGMADTAQVVTNAEGGCDYENFYVSENDTRADKALDKTKAGFGVQVPVVPFDDWMARMATRLPTPIQVLKMDTEGAEGRIVLGMQETLASCRLRNWIVELTPGHWYRFGQSIDDAAAMQAYVDVVEKHNFKAYLMYMQAERRPPPSMHDFIRPLDEHPGMPGQSGTGCEGAPYYEILDMRRFLFDYCLTFADTVVRAGGATAKGFCGNVWFQKQGCAD